MCILDALNEKKKKSYKVKDNKIPSMTGHKNLKHLEEYVRFSKCDALLTMHKPAHTHIYIYIYIYIYIPGKVSTGSGSQRDVLGSKDRSGLVCSAGAVKLLPYREVRGGGVLRE